MCTFEFSEIGTPPYTGQPNYGPCGVLIMEVTLYRTAYCGPTGVLSTEVSLHRTAYCGPNGVLSVEVTLYRTANYGPAGVLVIEVPLYSIQLMMWLVHSSL